MNLTTKIKLTAGAFILIFILGLFSCTKKSDEISEQQINEADMEVVNNNDFNETDNDLLTVDYKEFYDELAPHGEWIEVKANDIDVDMDIGSSSSESHRTISLSDFFGVKDAYAGNAAFGAFFVWKPSSELAVGVTAGGPVAYVPYTYGNWVYTDVGWYFRAASQPVDITHHYGRWVYSPAVDWVWVPGRVWAPSWVEWRENDTYIAWAPIPPSVYIINNVFVAAPIIEERYIIVEKRYFFEPTVYNYVYYNYQDNFMISDWHSIDGIMVTGNRVINKGPDITVIRNITGHHINTVKINHVNSKNKVKYTENEFSAFKPEFKRVKSDVKTDKIVNSPKKFQKFKEIAGNNKDNENGSKSKEEESASKNKEKGNENKDSDSKNNKGNYKEKNDGNLKNKTKSSDDGNKNIKEKNKSKEKYSGDNKNKTEKDKGNVKKNSEKDKSGKDKSGKDSKGTGNENKQDKGNDKTGKKDGKGKK